MERFALIFIIGFASTTASAGDGVPKRAKVSEQHRDRYGGDYDVIDYEWRCGLLWLRQCGAYQYINLNGTISPPLYGGGWGGNTGEGESYNSFHMAGDPVTGERYIVTSRGWFGPADRIDFNQDTAAGRYVGVLHRTGIGSAVFWGTERDDWHNEVRLSDYYAAKPLYAYRDGDGWWVSYGLSNQQDAEVVGPFVAIDHLWHVQDDRPAFTAYNGESWMGVWGELSIQDFDSPPRVLYGDGIVFEGFMKGVYTSVYLPEDPGESMEIHRYPQGERQREVVNLCDMIRARSLKDPEGKCEDIPPLETFEVMPNP